MNRVQLKLRLWMNRMEAFLMEVILNRRTGFFVTLIRGLLFCLARVFNIMVRVRHFVK